jgi:hypothetical protein
MNSPMCCGMPATWNVVSVRLAFWICKECRKEVLDLPSPEQSPFEYSDGGFYILPEVAGHWSDGTITKMKLAKE